MHLLYLCTGKATNAGRNSAAQEELTVPASLVAPIVLFFETNLLFSKNIHIVFTLNYHFICILSTIPINIGYVFFWKQEKPQYDTIGTLQYLDRFLSEVLRLYGAAGRYVALFYEDVIQ